jgi:hypothetical protein
MAEAPGTRGAAIEGPQRLDALAAIEAACWRELQRAAADRHHEWRTCTLATVDPSGAPDARTVVLREVGPDARELRFYTDARAQKVAQLAATQGAACLVFWSRRLHWQLRVRAGAEVAQEGLAVTSRWASLRSSPAAADYLTPVAPGSPVEAAAAPPVAAAPAAATGAAGERRHHFALLTATVAAIDWLELHPAGHRRAAFDAEGARWLVP